MCIGLRLTAANEGSQETLAICWACRPPPKTWWRALYTCSATWWQSTHAPWHVRHLHSINYWSALPRMQLLSLGHREDLRPITDPGAGRSDLLVCLQGWEVEESCDSEGWKLVFSCTRRKSPLPAILQPQNRFSAKTAGGGLESQSIKVSILA